MRERRALLLGLLVLGSSLVGPALAAPTAAASQTGSAAADLGPAPDAQVTGCDRNAGTFVRLFNAQIDVVPGFVRDRVRDSNVHLQLDGDQGGDYTLVTNESSQVVSYREGVPASASLLVVTDCETFRNITDAQDPGSAFRTAYDNDEIRFIGIGAINWLMFTALDLVTDPMSLAIVLLFIALLIVLVYVAYRRISSHYRGSEEIEPPEP